MPKNTLNARQKYALLLILAIITVWQIHTIPLNSMSWCQLIGQANAGDTCREFVLANIDAIFIVEHTIAVAVVGWIIFKIIKSKK